MEGIVMQTFSLKVNLAILFNGRPFVLEKRLIDRRLSFKDEFGEPLLLTEAEFYGLYDKKEIRVDPEQPLLGRIPLTTNAPPDLTFFPKSHSDEAIRRRKYLDALLGLYGTELPPNSSLTEQLKLIARSISDSEIPPSTSTVRRWLKKYLGMCVVRLVPRHDLKGRTSVIQGEVESLLQDVLNEEFLKEEPESVSMVYGLFRNRLIELNQQRLPTQKLHIPCEMSVRRYIERLDPFAIDIAQKGKFAAARKYRIATGELHLAQILDRWEIDHTLLDIQLVDPETGEVIGRAYITVVLDRYSRMVMAFLLHLSAPNTESVLRVIERAIRPKEAFLQRFPSVTNTWRARGLPLRIVPDNAAEFHADDLVQAFNELGIEILYPRSRGPEMKGGVERFFRTMNEGLIHHLPGTTFSNTQQRGDYPSEARACITLPELEKAISKWIVDVYHQRPHGGLGKRTPAQVWAEGEAQRTPLLPTDLDSLESVLAARKLVPVHHYGIETDGVKYHSDELAELRLRLSEGEKVEIRLRDELGHIWVKDRTRKCFILVPSKDKGFRGKSRDLFREARKLVRQNKGDPNDIDTVTEAYRQIQVEAEASKTSNKLRKRRYAASSRLDKEGQTRPTTAGPATKPSPRPASAVPKVDLNTPLPTIRPRSN